MKRQFLEEVLILSDGLKEVMGEIRPGHSHLLMGQDYVDPLLDERFGITLPSAANLLREDFFKNLTQAERRNYGHRADNIPMIDVYAYASWRVEHTDPIPGDVVNVAIGRILEMD